MNIAFAGLPDLASDSEKALVERLANFLESKRGTTLIRIKDHDSAEKKTPNTDVAVVFPEFPSDWAHEVVYQAHRNRRRVIFVHVGHAPDYMGMRVAMSDTSIDVRSEADFKKVILVAKTRQIEE